MHISSDRKIGNNWNPEIENIRNYKGNPLLDLYLQYENTDTNTRVYISDFQKKEITEEGVVRNDKSGNPRSYYFTYLPDNMVRFVRQMLWGYFNRKYKRQFELNHPTRRRVD